MTITLGALTSGFFSSKIAGNGAAVLPIPPQFATTATFEEVVLLSPSTMFSDSGATTPITGAYQSVASIKDVKGNVLSCTGITSRIDPRSGAWGINFDGVSSYVARKNLADVKTLFINLEHDGAGRRTRAAYETILGQPSANNDGYTLGTSRQSGIIGADVLRFNRYRSDSTNPNVYTPLVVGHVDCVNLVNDGTNYLFCKNGVRPAANAMAATGSPIALAGSNATLGCYATSGGSNSSFWRGKVWGGWAMSSQLIAESERPGVHQYFINMVAQKQTLTGWLGAFFQGDASGPNTTERASSHALVLKHFDETLQNSQYRPSSMPVNTGANIYGDFGLATDGTNVYFTWDSAQGTSYLMKFDGLNMVQLAAISVSATGSSQYGIGMTFARNADDTIYTDASGRAYLFFDGSPGTGNGIFYIRSTDNTWSTGGGWGTATLVSGFSVGSSTVNSIDPTVKRDSTGKWHMAWSDYYPPGASAQGNGQIRHASCTSTTPDGAWTLDSASDFYGLGDSVEGPQFVTINGVFSMLYDRDGCGYSIATLGNGMGATSTAISHVIADDIPEHGEICRIPANFPNPLLQATTTPRTYQGRDKGLLVSGYVGDNVASRSNGWSTNGFVGNTPPTISVSSSPVADPNGDLTATRVSIGAAGSSTSYGYVGVETIEGIATSGGFAGQMVSEVWVRGVAGGEVIDHLIISSDFSTAYVRPDAWPTAGVTLTTSWQRITSRALLAGMKGQKAEFCIGANRGDGWNGNAFQFDIWCPRLD